MPQPTAIWNTARDAWETPGTGSLFCGHSDVYSETFTTSGSMRNGAAYALPTWEQRMAGSGYSSSQDDDELPLFPTPRATRGGSSTEIMYGLGGTRSDEYRAQGNVLLPTPRTSDTNGAGEHGSGGLDLRTAIQLLQTPSAADATGGHERRGGARSSELLLKVQAKEMATDWGKYERAVRRQECAFGRPAPSPVEPNKHGGPRLSARFDEWLMGAPEGWITDVDISWNDKIKACGNGVVPQQAAAALRDMSTVFEGAQP